MGKLGIRVFAYRRPVWERHSYLVGNDQGGTTDVLGSVDIDNDRTTVEELRPIIETRRINMMNRRTPLFQECIEVMNNCKNFHTRPESDRRKYRFALITPDGDINNPDDIDLLTEEEEESTLARDLQPICCIVPMFYVGPVCQQVCMGCEEDTGWRRKAVLDEMDRVAKEDSELLSGESEEAAAAGAAAAGTTAGTTAGAGAAAAAGAGGGAGAGASGRG